MSFLKEYPQIFSVQQLAVKQKVRVYLVGGFCRDYLLRRPCLDFDFAVEKDSIGFARKFSRMIRGAFVLLDAEHGCARVVKKRPDGQSETYDFADFRGKGIRADVLQRDFTMNALSCLINELSLKDSLPAVLLDFCHGQRDLRAEKIRMVSPETFVQDPLRLLRAFSLQAELGFGIEPKTRQKIKKEGRLIDGVSYERIRDELFKVLETPRAATNIVQMDKLGLLKRIIPPIAVMAHVRQGGYHHLDVWEHTLEGLRQLEDVIEEFHANTEVTSYLQEPLAGGRRRLALLKLAMILHDIGKPQTYKKEGKKISFHSHECVGERAAKKVAELLKLSTQERFALQNMVLWHLRPGYLSNFKNPSRKAVFRYFRDTKKEAAAIAVLSLADQRATRGPMTKKKDQAHHTKICRKLIKEYFVQQNAKPFVRLINGNDLIRQLHLEPSPLFAKILRSVEESQSAGQLQDKKAALALAKKIADKEKKDESQKHRA